MNINIVDKKIVLIITTTILVVIMMYYYFTGKYINFMTSQSFINPTDSVYRMTSPFGHRIHPITGESSYHNGEDYACPLGTPLKAPAEARVASVYTNSAGGLQVILRHTNGFTTGYAHLSSVECNVGDIIAQGTCFARTGNSGASTGAHLHLTMRNPGGVRIAPSTYLYK